MDIAIFNNLATGFGAALSLTNLWFALVGVMLGTLIGVLPGIGPIPTIAMLLPVTFGLDPLSSLIMLAGIYYGAQYGGSTTSILVNMPGEASSIVTTLDGHPMARQGRAGTALSVAALGSFFAGCVGTVFIAAFGPMLAGIAQEFKEKAKGQDRQYDEKERSELDRVDARSGDDERVDEQSGTEQQDQRTQDRREIAWPHLGRRPKGQVLAEYQARHPDHDEDDRGSHILGPLDFSTGQIGRAHV